MPRGSTPSGGGRNQSTAPTPAVATSRASLGRMSSAAPAPGAACAALPGGSCTSRPELTAGRIQRPFRQGDTGLPVPFSVQDAMSNSTAHSLDLERSPCDKIRLSVISTAEGADNVSEYREVHDLWCGFAVSG